MPRKGENIYKRKDGRWEGRFIISYDSNGRAKYSYVYAKTYSEVKEKLFLAKSAHMNHNYLSPTPTKVLFCDCINEWLESKRLVVKESTFKRYQNTVAKHIIPRLGFLPVTKITAEAIEQFARDGLESGRLDGKGGLSAKTMSDILVIIKEIVAFSRKRGLLTECDLSEITIKRTTREMRVLSITEEQRLITILLREMDRYKMGVYLCLFTGIRIGELCALRWKDISFTERTLHVDKTMQRLQYSEGSELKKTRLIITDPKSISANRTIPLPDFIICAMRPFEAGSSSYVLSGCSNKAVEPRTMQNRFKGYLEEGQIDDANFHALRHTFATRCVELGFDIKTLSEILGHSSVKITLDKYVHSTLELKMNNMMKLSNSFDCKPS